MTGRELEAGDDAGGFRLTGWHVLAMCVAFFAVVAGVNGYMIRAAVGTFSGVEAENPYKEGLAFNRRLEASRQQQALGWAVDVALSGDAASGLRASVEVHDRAGMALGGLDGLVRLEWPTDRRRDRSGELADLGGGRYRADIGPVEPGQWDVVVELKRGGERVFASSTRKILR